MSTSFALTFRSTLAGSGVTVPSALTIPPPGNSISASVRAAPVRGQVTSRTNNSIRGISMRAVGPAS
jgi:hypothetical protein